MPLFNSCIFKVAKGSAIGIAELALLTKTTTWIPYDINILSSTIWMTLCAISRLSSLIFLHCANKVFCKDNNLDCEHIPNVQPHDKIFNNAIFSSMISGAKGGLLSTAPIITLLFITRTALKLLI